VAETNLGSLDIDFLLRDSFVRVGAKSTTFSPMPIRNTVTEHRHTLTKPLRGPAPPYDLHPRWQPTGLPWGLWPADFAPQLVPGIAEHIKSFQTFAKFGAHDRTAYYGIVYYGKVPPGLFDFLW